MLTLTNDGLKEFPDTAQQMEQILPQWVITPLVNTVITDISWSIQKNNNLRMYDRNLIDW